ncbi:MAG TPA: acyltransferase [Candidatus Poseidoniaceae archaeon]|jgi:acetyltransferase-like isoleucine patch superfamily enzyme|nr:acyltransferase [Candidatus Poseidoniaceae archaeon]
MKFDSPPGQRIELGRESVAWAPCHMGADVNIGKECSIGALAHIGRKVTIGDACRVQGGAYIADECELGDRVFIGPNATILNDKYPPSRNSLQWQPVQIGNDSVIGGGATVIAGCSVGNNAVLGAGSTLTRNLPDNEVWAGNPAVFLMMRNVYNEKQLQLKIETANNEQGE